jgi:hypothetical protein
MKRNFLKTSLSAFAFTMAIVASFAFSPALNDAEDVLVDGYIQTEDPDECQPISHECEDGSAQDCTVTIIGAGPAPVYELDTNGTTCTFQLTKIQ